MTQRVAFILALCTGFLLCLPASHALELTSKKVLEYSVQSLSAKVSLLDDDIALQDLKLTQAQYDPTATGNFNYTKDQSERSTTVFGTETSDTIYSASLSQLTPGGTSLNLGYTNTKTTTNSAFATNPSQFDSRVLLSLDQPLLNNFFGFATRGKVTAAKRNQEATIEETRLTLLNLAYNNLKVYWNLYLAKRLHTINASAVSTSQTLLRTNRQKKSVGLIEDTDLFAFEANADIKQSELIDTHSMILSHENLLRRGLDLPKSPISIGTEKFIKKRYAAVETLISSALERHPQISNLRKTLDAQNIQVAIQKNARLPLLDLNASLTLNGIDPAYTAALADIGAGNPIWTAGVSLTVPLLNRAARASYTRDKLVKEQLITQLKIAQNQVITQIKTGYEIYLRTYEQMQVLARAVQHQRLKWEGETKRYDQGRSDPDIVIRYQNDFLDTQKLYLNAQVRFALAQLDLDYFIGRID